MRDAPPAATLATTRRSLRDARRLAMRGDRSVDPRSGDTSRATATSMGPLARARSLCATSGIWREVAGNRRISRAVGWTNDQDLRARARGSGLAGGPASFERSRRARCAVSGSRPNVRARGWVATSIRGCSRRMVLDVSRSCRVTAAVDATVGTGPVDRPPPLGEGGGATEASSGASARRDRANLEPPCTRVDSLVREGREPSAELSFTLISSLETVTPRAPHRRRWRHLGWSGATSSQAWRSASGPLRRVDVGACVARRGRLAA